MTGIDSYSTTPATNATADGGAINWAEAQPPSSVNNTARQWMADERSRQNDLIWFQYGTGDQGAGNIAVPSVYASSTSFTITGANVTAVYHASRRVRAVGVSTGTIYGSISSSSYNSGNTKTTVNMTWDSGSLSNETLVISLAQVPVTGKPVAAESISGAGSFTTLAASGAITGADGGTWTSGGLSGIAEVATLELAVAPLAITHPILIGGLSSSSTTYGAISFNNTLAHDSFYGIAGGGGTDVNLYVSLGSAGALAPLTSNTFSLGASGSLWTAVWATNGTIQTSDERRKNILATQRDFRSIIEELWLGDAEWKNRPGSCELVGLAQQIYPLFPQAVVKPATDSEDWGVHYGGLAPLALWGVKDLYRENIALRADIELLKGALRKLGVLEPQ